MLGGGASLGVPNAVWVFAAAVAVLTVVFTRTRFGARVRAIGPNPEAAEFGALPVTRIAVLALSGLMAGKSTLVKILSGVVRPEGGADELDGAPVRFADARQAAAQGAAIVSQESLTYDDLTVLENLFP